MAENADTGNLPQQNLKNLESEKPSELPATPAELADIIPKQVTENMETHAHSLHKAPGKGKWHYFFEFIMLFFAVFCGFLAENWREELREHKREKEFIHSIVTDLKSDTAQSNKILRQLKAISAGIDSVLYELTSPGIFENSNNAYRLWTKNLGLEVFVSNDRTIQQLKNSGELRLIRKKAVSDGIMEYDQTLKKYNVQSNLMYSALSDVTDYSQVFDFIRLNNNMDKPVPLTEQGKKLLNQAYANLHLWNRGLTGLIGWLEVVNAEGEKLLILLHKEYKTQDG